MRYRSAHSQRLERFFGPEALDKLLRAAPLMPVLVGMPRGAGALWSYRGDVIGRFDAGHAAGLADYAWEWWARRRQRIDRALRGERGGFASLSDLIAEATTGGKLQTLHFTKAGTTGVVGVMNSLARVGPNPAGQATAAAFAAGESPTNTTPAGLGMMNVNPAIGDTLHPLSAVVVASVASQLLCLVDRFYHGNWNLANTPQAVSGVPTRYQDATARGAFISAEVSTALGAGTPTVTLTYVDQDGNPAEATTNNLAIAASAIVNRFPHATPDWHYRLNTGDVGVRALTNLSLSAASTGNLNVFLAKPIVFLPLPATANLPVPYNFVNSLFNLPEIVPNACLVLLELFKSATTATNYTGLLALGSG